MSIPVQSIIIAEADAGVGGKLQSLLLGLRYPLPVIASTNGEAMEKTRLLKPSVALIGLPGAMETIRQIASLGTTAALLLREDPSPSHIREALDAGAFGILVKPVNMNNLAAALEGAWHQFQVVQALEHKNRELSEALEMRKLLDRAKGILMEQQGLSENQAHQTLQKMSQDQGISLKELCRSVIQVQMILGNKNTSNAKKHR